MEYMNNATSTFQPTRDQAIVLDLVLNGEMGMSSAIRRALDAGQDDFAAYLRTF